MAQTDRTKISEYSATADSNINIGTTGEDIRLGEYGTDSNAEAARPQDVNNAIRELMSHLKDMDAGTQPLTSPDFTAFSIGAVDVTSTAAELNQLYGTTITAFAKTFLDDTTADEVRATIDAEKNRLPIKADEAIVKGAPVYATGTVGASGKITVSNFIADSSLEEIYLIGVADRDLALNDEGFAISFGELVNMQTDGQDATLSASETWSDGEILYASAATAGFLTKTAPTSPDQAIPVAIVVYSHSSSGILFVRPTIGSHIGELHDVISDATQGSNDNEVLAWDSTAGVYQNQTAAEAGLAGLSGATFTGPITVPQGSLGSESIVISGSTTDFGLYNTGAGLVVSDGTNISFVAYSNEIVTYIPVRPSSDNTGTLGTASIRYSNVYSINGTFNSVTINGNNDLASFLSDPTSAKLATAVTDETGSGALVFGTAPTLSQVHDDSTISYNGTDYGIGYRSIPAVSTTGAVTASAAHNGKCITANGTITVPSTLAVGTVISVWVNSPSTISIAKSGGTMYLNGTSVTSVTAAAYGIATIYFPSSSTMVVTGNVS
jgi:hypothetical protein